jgi:hypothetical protein
VVALSRSVPMGEAWHVAVFIVGHRCSWCRSGS